MNETQLKKLLSPLALGPIRFYETIGSTNDEALAWALQGAPDLSLIVADEQTRGRGRMDRRWFTPPGTALAMSLILRPSEAERAHPSRTTGLLALSLVDALHQVGLSPQIKWPNDVLVNRRKLAGILVETTWMGEEADAMVLGMGVNVLTASVPPADQVLFPATSIQSELGRPVDRAELLRDILTGMLEWRPRLGIEEFIETWEAQLAFRGEQVRAQGSSGDPFVGKLIGLNRDGSLQLLDEYGKSVTVQFGEVRLRPVA